MWLGQAGFRFRFKDTPLIVDPFFGHHEQRLYGPPADDVLGSKIDWLLITHEHGDHLDLELLHRLVRLFPRMTVVVPAPLAHRVAAAEPSARVIGIEAGQHLQAGDVLVRAVAAVHAVAADQGYSNMLVGSSKKAPFLGYALVFGDMTVFHAGDTLVNDAARVLGRVDVAILPTNGRDHDREGAGIVGNCSAREAVQWAVELGARLLIPMHHDLIAGNTERAGACADIARDLDAPLHVLALRRFMPLVLPIPTDTPPTH
jgi:L-ascorbate 6-phosphate lactonase